MAKLHSIIRLLKIALVVAGAVMTAGCGQMNDWLQGGRTASANDSIILGAPEAETYLNDLFELADGDPATQAEIFADAESAATLTPGPNTLLRLALVLATPSHPASDPNKAQSMLRDVLARTQLLTPAEVSLATIHLNYVERLIVVQAEARRLRTSSSRAARTEEQAVSQRLASVEAENRQLRRDLEAAENKLDAITSIEKSIREQE